MTNYEIKMPAGYAAIEEEEMTYLVGGADDPQWLSYLKKVGTTFSHIARVFSSVNSIINNIGTIYNSIAWLNSNVPNLFGTSKA